MRYVFADNYRGFSNAIVPLRSNTFFVGENSTGKSSLLKLIYALSQPYFWISPVYVLREIAELGGYDDIVSAWAKNQSYFRVGALSFVPSAKDVPPRYDFALFTFSEKDGAPYLARYVQYSKGQLVKLSFLKKVPTYKVTEPGLLLDAEDEALQFFQTIAETDRADATGFKKLPGDLAYTPLPVAAAMVRRITSGEGTPESDYSADMPFDISLTWIAPIRTKPQRFYGGPRKTFSPEGEHTPFLLQRSRKPSTLPASFRESLNGFGTSSGLFETVRAHSFGVDPQAPFEVVVRFDGADLNVINVGYGVSQVLPLIVDFLYWGRGRTFAVQQPEIHLHPRAQAALGDLIYQLSHERQASFVVETHSEYLLDRFRVRMHEDEDPPDAQVVFFEHVRGENRAHVLPIEPDGRYPSDQPAAFRDFFVNEAMKLLEI